MRTALAESWNAAFVLGFGLAMLYVIGYAAATVFFNLPHLTRDQFWALATTQNWLKLVVVVGILRFIQILLRETGTVDVNPYPFGVQGVVSGIERGYGKHFGPLKIGPEPDHLEISNGRLYLPLLNSLTGYKEIGHYDIHRPHDFKEKDKVYVTFNRSGHIATASKT